MSADTETAFYLGWGNGWYGRLAQGEGEWDDAPHPVVLRRHARTDEPVVPRPVLTAPVLVAGAAHVVTLDDNGTVATHGKCHFGQLGHGMLDRDVSLPQTLALELAPGDAVVSVHAGESSGFAVCRSGAVFAWGCGFFHGLGSEDESHALTPRRVDTEWPWLDGSAIVDIVGGGSHLIVRLASGLVATGGGNQWGQTAHNRPDASSLLVDVCAQLDGLGIVAADASRRNSIFLAANGTVYTCGAAATGVLGVAADSDAHELVALAPDACFDGEHITMVALGAKHAVAASDAAVFTWGCGVFGRLGHGSHDSVVAPTRVVFPTLPAAAFSAVAAGSSHTVALAGDAELWSWGSAVRGKQLTLCLAEETNSRQATASGIASLPPSAAVLTPTLLDLSAFAPTLLGVALGTNHTFVHVRGSPSAAIAAQDAAAAALRRQLADIQAAAAAEAAALLARGAASAPPPPPPPP